MPGEGRTLGISRRCSTHPQRRFFFEKTHQYGLVARKGCCFFGWTGWESNLERWENTEVESGALTLRLRAPRTPWTAIVYLSLSNYVFFIWCRDLSLAVDQTKVEKWTKVFGSRSITELLHKFFLHGWWSCWWWWRVIMHDLHETSQVIMHDLSRVPLPNLKTVISLLRLFWVCSFICCFTVKLPRAIVYQLKLLIFGTQTAIFSKIQN